jgi:hypothetical protein
VKRFAIAGAGVAIAAAGVAMYLAPGLYEVVDKGRDIRPYESGPIYEIRLADTVTVYASAESRPDTDAISGSAMVALATAALMTWLLLAARGAPDRLRRFYGLAALGFAALALDEFFAIHETIGHNLLFLSDIPGVERPDDVIFALLAVPALVFLYYFRDIVTSSKRAVRLFIAALILFAFAGLSDLAGVGTDEPLEVLSAACIVGGFVSLIVMHLSSALELGSGARTAPSEPAATAPALAGS